MPVTEIGEPIAVIVSFRGGKALPLQLSWNGHRIKLKRVTGSWKVADGKNTLFFFACLGENDVYYEISFSTPELVWRLEKLETA